MTDLFMNVYRRMNEPHRKYHTFNHICEMFQYAQERGIELTDVQVHAILFHDIVYKVPADPELSNEKASSFEAEKTLALLGFASTYIDKVVTIIEDTEKELPTIEESKIVIDLDLAGLGDNYWKNKFLIRDEFAHVDDEAFNAGRAKWLQSMLDRDSIFVSGLFDDFEQLAVDNIKTELEMLRA